MSPRTGRTGLPAEIAEDRAWDGLVVFCAANNYDGIKLADQHFAEQLSKLVPVLYVDPPISCLIPLKRPRMAASMLGPRVRMLTPRLARLTPVVEPFPSKRRLAGLTARLVRRHLRGAAAHLGAPRIEAVVSAWPQYPVFGTLRERVSVYWAQDDFVGGAALLGLDAQHLDACERRVAASADFIVAANPVVADGWRARGGDVVLIPYGADIHAYANVDQAPRAPDADLNNPIVGFVGHINSRIDMRLLEAIADRGRSLLLVGPRDLAFEPKRFAALVRRPNVRWVGAKPFDTLPGYLRAIDVGVVPYGDGAFNRGSFPLKTLEYLAAGRAVVSTDLPATRWLDTNLVATASEPETFADHVDRLLDEGRGDGALIASRRQFAAKHSWPARAGEFYDAILTHRPAQRRLRLTEARS
jgi:teichuronic acid biosynthesis glycosyltransferase TuaH